MPLIEYSELFRRMKVYLFCLLLAPLAIASGCGKQNGNLSPIGGSVTLDGKPIEQGTIAFLPIDGTKGPAAGGKIEKGRYRIDGKHGVAVGWNRVEIRATKETGRMILKGLGATGEKFAERVECVAGRFNSDSMLKVEVKPGENTANFEVASN